MGATIQARLDNETQGDVEQLASQLGLSPSQVVREGIRLMKEKHKPHRRKKVIGVGMCDSGLSDLSVNPKHMEGYGS